MTSNHVRIVLAAAVALSYAALSGCGEKKYKPPTIDAAELAGQWIQAEKRAEPKAGKGRFGGGDAKPEKFQRHIVINADKTFVFSLRDMAGNPYKDNLKAEGTWELDKETNLINFTVANNTFKSGDDGADWVPQLGLTLREEPVGSGAATATVLTLEETSGNSGKYTRAG